MSFKAFEMQEYISALFYKLSEKRLEFLKTQTQPYTVTEMDVVVFVGKRKECIMKDISASLLITKNNLTAVVDKLEKKEILIRRRSADDGRIVVVSLTENGQQLFRDEMQIHFDYANGLLSNLDKTEQHQFLTLLSKVAP